MRDRIQILVLISLATSIIMGVTLCDAVALDEIVKAELQVIVPEEIQSDAKTATFKLVAEGTNLHKIDKVVWNVYYYNFYEKKDVYLEPITETTLSDLEVKREGGDLSIAEMDRLCREFGATRQGNFGLTFSVFVEAFAEGKEVGKSPLYSAIFDFIALRDLSLTVSGPDEIRPDNRRATFDLKSDGKDLVRVENVGWIFEYHTDEEGWVQDLWGGWVPVLSQNQRGIVKPINSDLELRDEGKSLNLSHLRELVESHGSISGETKALQMRVYVRAYLTNDEKVTLAKSDPHEFRVLAGDVLTLDLYPTRANQTSVKLKGTGTGPINIAMEQNPPAHIIVTHERVIAPQGGRYPELEIKVELDPSRTPGLQLPSEEEIVFITESGTQENNFTLKLSLKKAEWLVMIYLAHDTSPSIQRHMEGNLVEICDVSRRMDDPRVGIIVLTDMEFRFVLDPSLHGINGLPPNNAQLFRIVKGNLTQVGQDWNSVGMNTQAILQRFISESISRIPSIRKQLVISGHGHGVKGVAPDRSAGNRDMLMPVLDRALTNQVFDVISFEACVMAQLEALNEIREHATYFTASERTIPAALGQGWISKTYIAGGMAWEKPLEGLLSRPGMSPRDYVVLLVQSYGEKYSEGGSFRTSATLSAIEAQNLPPLVACMDSLATAIVARYGAHSELFNKTLADVVKRTWEANHVPYTDIRDFAQNIINDPNQVLRGLIEPAQAVVAAFDNAIIANTEIIIKHPKSALFLDRIGLDATIDYLTRIDSGYSGMTIMLWREGVTGTPGAIYRLYLRWFDSTEYRTKAWRRFIQEFARSHPTSATTINLHHPMHELYLHVYDSEGHHVGVNPDEAHGCDRLDMEIPGSLYIDFMNGTEIVLLPANITDLVVVVDGMSMEEEVEEYTLTYELVLNDEVTHCEEVSGTIHEASNHSMPLSTEGSKLSIGKVNISSGTGETSETSEDGEEDRDGGNGGKQLPDWFIDGFPFLMPLVEPVLDPLLPYTPYVLIPFLPLIVLGLPLLVVVVIAVRVVRGRKRDE